MDINICIKNYVELIEKELDRLLPQPSLPYADLFSAARYSLLGAAKRLRPILALTTTEVLCGDIQAAVVPACALELVHTYSLIHDDLPCMDDDDFRRGKPSLHRAYPEGHAVLTGDFLLTYAFELLAKAPRLSADQKVKLIEVLSMRAGGHGMIAGQVVDIACEGKDIDLETLKQIHRNKTGAMLLASIEFGAIIAGASEEQVRLLRSFGDEIGLAFQIVDDILDVTASKQKHGKEVSSDAANNKMTYVSLLGLEQSQTMAENLSASAISRLKNLKNDASLLVNLAQLMVHRKA